MSESDFNNPEAVMTKRRCAWSQKDTEGKVYFLDTSDGREIVSEEEFRKAGGSGAGVSKSAYDKLAKRVADLEARLDQLVADVEPTAKQPGK